MSNHDRWIQAFAKDKELKEIDESNIKKISKIKENLTNFFNSLIGKYKYTNSKEKIEVITADVDKVLKSNILSKYAERNILHEVLRKESEVDYLRLTLETPIPQLSMLEHKTGFGLSGVYKPNRKITVYVVPSAFNLVKITCSFEINDVTSACSLYVEYSKAANVIAEELSAMFYAINRIY